MKKQNLKPEPKLENIQEDLEKLEKLDQENEEVTLLKRELQEAQTKYLRAIADYQNLEKRVAQEKQIWIKMANSDLLIRFLTIADDLDRAANFIKDAGLNMVRDNLTKLLAEFGVEEIQVLGKKFDHEIMECVGKEECKDKRVVVKVESKGYKLYDKVIRPAKVIVGQ
ncbi:nucleotide exchange factor GrpE [Candidatus Beckwithbacteria bacterium]|nr:nucleotide exchange factor GrpE [Candidatus Beckwithbacteria bacterium]